MFELSARERMSFVSGFSGVTVQIPGKIGICMRRKALSRDGRRSIMKMTDDFEDMADQLAQEAGAMSPPPEIVPGVNGLEYVLMNHEESKQSARVYKFGATVQSWTQNKREVFFTSKEAVFNGKKAIRAGIPICFPQFGPYGDLPSHGFARITEWEVSTLEVLEDGSVYTELKISNETESDLIKSWSGDKKWEAVYAVTLNASGLETALRVTNNGAEPIEFTAALHNYINCSNVEKVRVFGLDNSKYMDRLDGDKEKDEPDDMGSGVAVTEETDRIYTNIENEVVVFDSGKLHVLTIRKTPTLPDTTLWNPFGSDGCDSGWKNFVCVEAAVISTPAVVAPGETWTGAQLFGLDI
eukprot:CAMPEP_0184738352 /NCGR_PEP_ID=MMETSP0315-20130426/1022_1 /TAXON_ID=101924 /ORGANISM="Rhodosorus marinus, Strain UTEX LB 2760" /LENGTH=353 /DNA_ID=CAMNT_0027206027 /DNA_START=22 /DNA_END=1083 /DNA_ORIENTATION=-